MIIKKYIAATEKEAVSLAKAELGEDVTIMNIKENNPKGLSRLFKKSSVEVTAAIDDVKTESKTPERKSIRILQNFNRHLMEMVLHRLRILRQQEWKKIRRDCLEIIRL